MEPSQDQVTAAALLQLKRDFPNIQEIQKRYGDTLVNTEAGKRGNFFSLDPNGVLGLRQKIIEEISEKYQPGQGFTGTFGMGMYGITEQDVANFRMTKYNQLRKDLDPNYEYGEINFQKDRNLMLQLQEQVSSQVQIALEIEKD